MLHLHLFVLNESRVVVFCFVNILSKNVKWTNNKIFCSSLPGLPILVEGSVYLLTRYFLKNLTRSCWFLDVEVRHREGNYWLGAHQSNRYPWPAVPDSSGYTQISLLPLQTLTWGRLPGVCGSVFTHILQTYLIYIHFCNCYLLTRPPLFVSSVFIYSMPGYSCSIKERMLYSSCKSRLLDEVERDFHLEVAKKVKTHFL